jgi:predicted metal-dependent peptidase
MAKPAAANNPALVAYQAGVEQLRQHPLLEGLSYRAIYYRYKEAANRCPEQGWVLMEAETMFCHPKRLSTPSEWAYYMAHGLLYGAFNFIQPDKARWPEWCAACDVVIFKFLKSLKFGTPRTGWNDLDDKPGWDEQRWYKQFCETGIPDWAKALSPAGDGHAGMIVPTGERYSAEKMVKFNAEWAHSFATGLSHSVGQAVEIASGERVAFSRSGDASKLSAAEKAWRWFISSYPLLGAMVATFELIEDVVTIRREDIRIAAINERSKTLYINPHAGLTAEELKFVMAHEVLHVALRHTDRCQGRDHQIWNIACDYAINDWLLEMQLGQMPSMSLLHDPALKGLSAESIYDIIVTDMRRIRKLQTFAGAGCDMLQSSAPPTHTDATDLDSLYREMLGKGLALHESQGRGLLPAGMMEEIKAILQAPIDWDVELARWFEHFFPPVEKKRTFSRISRRQSATPDIVRPLWVADTDTSEGRTFGVVIDTSGSMSRHLLSLALGAIAGYALAHEVVAVRLVYCDAAAHDAGYLAPEAIADRLEVKGRGGTVLQPGITLLQDAVDFPKNGPILIITDGYCDAFQCSRDCAVLVPKGQRLPFSHRYQVYYFE